MTTPSPEELRKLLENAAKACGKTAYWSDSLEDWQKDLTNPTIDGKEWQPHLPGLDSQVLAAELGIDTCWDYTEDCVMCCSEDETCYADYADHPSKAHAQAMAVLRVAAAIGEALP